MKQFKKRTIALVLASVVTVVGAFGAENYKNSLMSLKFESGASGAVSMTLLTKRNYEQTITPVKKDATTYVIMLPETNSQMPSSPELAGDIESVNVRTMPYTTSSKGYTKITIKTTPNAMLTAQKALYIPEKKAETSTTTPSERQENRIVDNYDTSSRGDIGEVPARSQSQKTERVTPIRSRSGVDQTNPVDIKKSVKQFEPNTQNNLNNVQVNTIDNNTINKTPLPQTTDNNTSDIVLMILGVLLVIILCVFFFIKAKNNMAAIIGEQPDFSDDEDIKKKQIKADSSKRKQIKNTISKLDRMYSRPTKMPIDDFKITPTQAATPATSEETTPQVENVVVDLDELFQEKTNPLQAETKADNLNEEGENSALEDFLSGFSFDDTHFLQNDEHKQEQAEVEEEKEGFDEELYEKFINDENLKFSKSDIEKIEKLLNSEISDDTMRNLEKFVVTNPIEKKPSQRELLENFVTTYTVNQNVSFTKDDVDALHKLMSVELDNDFITDLKTNPERINQMQNEIKKQNSKPHKSSELLTLNVKDMLPDLSEALKRQGGRKIESEVKPDVVYFSEGYEVSTLSLKDALPNLAEELNNEEAYKSRPSDAIELAVSGYDAPKMSVAGTLPDLEDALNNPEKYEDKKEVVKEVDEDALLKNISNVSFKPIYDGNEDTEFLNDFDDSNAPTVSDIQEEFSKLDGNFEIVNEEQIEITNNQENDVDDFESLYDNNFVDFDVKPEEFLKNNAKQMADDISIASLAPAPSVKPSEKPSEKPKRSDDAQKLIKSIEEKKAEQAEKQLQKEHENTLKQDENKVEEQIESEQVENDNKTFVIEDEIYEIITKSNITDRLGCYLAKNSSGYTILGFIGDKIFKIKNYEQLKNEKLQTRESEKLDDGTIRYIVRIGVHKFILNVKDDKMEFVMDLC